MPRSWLYYTALVLLVVFPVLLLDTSVSDWLWYQHDERLYYALAEIKVQPQFVQFMGGWKLPLFVVTVIGWWQIEETDESIPAQFLMLPLAYVPFAIVGDILAQGLAAPTLFSTLYMYPLVIVPCGYVYVIAWAIFIWLLGKLGLVVA